MKPKPRPYAQHDLDRYIDALAEEDESRKKLFKELLVDSAVEREILCRSVSLKKDFEYAMTFCELEDFNVPINRALFYWIKQMIDTGACTLADFSPLMLADYLEQRNLLPEVGGAANAEIILTNAPNPETSIVTACNRLREKHAERKLIGRSMRVCDRREKDITDVSRQDVIDELLAANREYEERISTVRNSDPTLGQLTGNSPIGLQEFLKEPPGRRITCGLPSLDRMMNGFKVGEFIILGARPGMGKTSMAIQLATDASADGVLFASYEMTTQQLVQRMACQVLESTAENIGDVLGTGNFPGREILDSIFRANQYWLDTSRLKKRTVEELSTTVKQLKANGIAIKLVIVDYLQIMQVEASQKDRGGNRVGELGKITAGLSQLAKDEEVCVVALSQLKRNEEKGRKDTEIPPRPTMSDLRDSGTLEQDAVKIVIVHRPEVYIKNGEVPFRMQGLAEFIVAKNRFGSTGIVRLRWRGPFQLFSEMREYEQVEAALWDQPGTEDV